MTTELDFIDISHFQPEAGTLNWSKVAQSVKAVILKATEGSTYLDPTYESNRLGAEAAGLSVATYHYLRHGNVSAQMEWYLKKVAPVPGERLVIDYEEENCTIGDLIGAVSYLQDNPDWEITVYGAQKLTDDINAYDGDAGCLRSTSLWAARYSTSQPVIATKIWPVWSAWQYSDSGHVDGIVGNVDCNMFNGSTEAMLKWFGPASVPEPEPEPEPEVAWDFLVALSLPPEQARNMILTVTVNGEPYEG